MSFQDQLKAVQKGAQRQAQDAAVRAQNEQCGKQQRDGSIYLGVYEPCDNRGMSLGMSFNVFAAPQDLPSEPVNFSPDGALIRREWDGEDALWSYEQAKERISELKNWHGRNGERFENENELFAALGAGTYKGGWVIPPMEIIAGTAGAQSPGTRRMKDNFFDRSETGALAGTFKTNGERGDTGAWYMSSTPAEENSRGVLSHHLTRNVQSPIPASGTLISCRPVRFERVT